MSRRTVKWKELIRQAGSREKALACVACEKPAKQARFAKLVDKLFPK
jgi:hypothetical protein